jgi:hypothetical protein
MTQKRKLYKPLIHSHFRMLPSDPKGSLDDLFLIKGGVILWKTP